MKSFKGVVAEAAKPKSRVILFGRMNPITSGHEENVEAAHKIAQKHGADLHVIASHSQDAKKNPLTAEHKLKHLKRAFGHLSNTEVKTSSKEAPTILHHAAQAHAAGVKHLIIAGGGDRAASYHKLLHDYNGVKGKAHGHYKFDKISIENTGERKAGVSGTDMRKHASSGNYDKFKAGLPSKIRSNNKHSQELYQHVRSGMGVHEDFVREDYVAGRVLKIGESVVDTHTGMTGKIVYRGPTYVTLQLDENLSVKRWLGEVDALTESEHHTDAPMITGFKDYLGLPADVVDAQMSRLTACPEAMDKFKNLLEDPLKDAGLVYSALDSTAKYLAIETFAAKNLDSINDHSISEFNHQVRSAAQKLHVLGVLPDHETYIQQHIETMNDLIHRHELAQADQGDQYMVKEQAKMPTVQDPDVSGHMDDEDLRDIEKSIDKLEWSDIEHLYDEQEHEEAEEEYNIDGNLLPEDLTVAQRMKKKVDFMKTKARRQIARRVALHRASTPGKLKKRAIIHAKAMLARKIYRGRNRSELSVGEKNRLEGILRKSKAAVVRISNRLLPKMRELENKRLSRLREEAGREPNQATDLIYDGEEHSADTVARNDTDTTGNDTLAFVKAHLAGITAAPRPGDVKSKEHVKRMKKFRNMED